MHVRLKGINRTTKTLASGQKKTYYFAWKGGPALVGLPGTPEFHASYNAAVALKKTNKKNEIRTLVETYLSSQDFNQLSASTKRQYLLYIKRIDAEFGDMPITALADRRVRSDFLAWRDKIGEKSPRTADFAYAVLQRIVAFGYNRGLAPANPCERPGRLAKSSRADVIWTDTDVEAFNAVAPKCFQLAIALALWTGQRQGDLLGLRWSDYDGKHLKFEQDKTKAKVLIPVAAPLRELLEEEWQRVCDNEGEVIAHERKVLRSQRDRWWEPSSFRHEWKKVCDRAGIEGKTFHDLRGTAVTRLALAGCTEIEIAMITGHALRDVGSILEAHYLNRHQGLAESAMKKLEAHASLPNQAPNRGVGQPRKRENIVEKQWWTHLGSNQGPAD